jgi:hypothetical protein
LSNPRALPKLLDQFFALSKPIREIDLRLAQHAASVRSFAPRTDCEFGAQGLEL